MKILRGFAIILGFLAVGEVVSILIGHFLPGSVIGMVLLFLALCFKLVRPEWVKDVAKFLTDNMTIFFVPPFMGILEQWGVIRMNFWGWIGILVVTTALVMAAAAGTAEIISRRVGK